MTEGVADLLSCDLSSPYISTTRDIPGKHKVAGSGHEVVPVRLADTKTAKGVGVQLCIHEYPVVVVGDRPSVFVKSEPGDDTVGQPMRAEDVDQPVGPCLTSSFRDCENIVRDALPMPKEIDVDCVRRTGPDMCWV